jgi:hypothetical protein
LRARRKAEWSRRSRRENSSANTLMCVAGECGFFILARPGRRESPRSSSSLLISTHGTVGPMFMNEWGMLDDFSLGDARAGAVAPVPGKADVTAGAVVDAGINIEQLKFRYRIERCALPAGARIRRRRQGLHPVPVGPCRERGSTAVRGRPGNRLSGRPNAHAAASADARTATTVRADAKSASGRAPLRPLIPWWSTTLATSQACPPARGSASRRSMTAFGSSPSTTRSGHGCHLCLRYGLLPMCPVRTVPKWRPRWDQTGRTYIIVIPV